MAINQKATANSSMDEFAILQILHRHQIYIDSRDAEGYASVFTEDAAYESPFASANGRYELIAMTMSLHESGFTQGKRHFVGPALIEVDSDRAESLSYWWVADYTDGVAVFATGVYEDDLKKIDGKWYISRRKLIQDG